MIAQLTEMHMKFIKQHFESCVFGNTVYYVLPAAETPGLYN